MENLGEKVEWHYEDGLRSYLEDSVSEFERLPITRLEGKRKLSQNRDAADQAGVRQGLLANSNPQDHALAHLMVKE